MGAARVGKVKKKVLPKFGNFSVLSQSLQNYAEFSISARPISALRIICRARAYALSVPLLAGMGITIRVSERKIIK